MFHLSNYSTGELDGRKRTGLESRDYALSRFALASQCCQTKPVITVLFPVRGHNQNGGYLVQKDARVHTCTHEPTQSLTHGL